MVSGSDNLIFAFLNWSILIFARDDVVRHGGPKIR
jgi:hypothetical protein